MDLGNLGDPILIEEIDLAGVAGEPASEGDQAQIYVRLALTADEKRFHKIAKGLQDHILYKMRGMKERANLEIAKTILLVVKPDKSAELWVDKAAETVTIRPKYPIKAGALVFERDIADIVELKFPKVDIDEEDQVICIIRHGWRFGLCFDFNPEKKLPLEHFQRELGTLIRRMWFRDLLDTVADPDDFPKMISAGWFPFIEIFGDEFNGLASFSQFGKPLSPLEEKLTAKFDSERLEKLMARWLVKPHFKEREVILKSAIKSFESENYVAVIKTVLTEIEGILSDAHRRSVGRGAKIKELLRFAIDQGKVKAPSETSLYLPDAFDRYLTEYTYSNFDPEGDLGHAGSRHAVGHGAADPQSYTKVRALQAILTLDQLAFYT